jgi:hypothetical protein
MADSLEVGHRVEALAAEMLDLKGQIANLTAVLSKFITEKNTQPVSPTTPKVSREQVNLSSAFQGEESRRKIAFDLNPRRSTMWDSLAEVETGLDKLI